MLCHRAVSLAFSFYPPTLSLSYLISCAWLCIAKRGCGPHLTAVTPPGSLLLSSQCQVLHTADAVLFNRVPFSILSLLTRRRFACASSGAKPWEPRSPQEGHPSSGQPGAGGSEQQHLGEPCRHHLKPSKPLTTRFRKRHRNRSALTDDKTQHRGGRFSLTPPSSYRSGVALFLLLQSGRLSGRKL